MASVSQELQEKLDSLKFTEAEADDNTSNNDSQRAGATDDDTTGGEDNSNLAQLKLLEYIEALKFNPDLIPPIEKESSVSVVAEILGENLDKNTMNKGNKRGTGTNKSKVNFSNSKIPSGTYDEANNYGSYLRSQPPQTFAARVPSSSSKKSVKRSYTKVIREWGKRPMLIESEAPWTPRNQSYFRAVKTLAKPNPRQDVNSNMQQAIGIEERSSTRGYPPNAVPIFPNGMNPASLWNPPYSAMQGPVVTRISPQPPEKSGGRPQLAVAVDSPYQYQELVVPFQPPQPQPVLFGHLNSQGLWMPLIQQQHQFQMYQPRPQVPMQLITNTGSYSNLTGESSGSDTKGT
ncbi:unnamed protein product [Orchesella dallaii]|uniref:Uncharacterized protein n=1 Tax=Orchesella dallaii TaxID=48710 RepID=A0ABP1QXB3_9HEXA